MAGDSTDVPIAADETKIFNYSCAFTDEPAYSGTSTATVSWPGESLTATSAVTFSVDQETDETVEVWDDQTDPANPKFLGTATWNADGLPLIFPYTLTLQGEVGQCIGYTNTAWLGLSAGYGPEAGGTVTVCDDGSLSVSTAANPVFDRHYLWSIAKSVDATAKDGNSLGQASFDFTVSAIPAGYEDSGWRSSGTITVTNPYAVPVRVDVTRSVEVGVGSDCTVVAGHGAVVNAEASVDFAYTCTFAGEPDSTGTGTTTVTWPDNAVVTNDTVTFALGDEIDKIVDVWDDKTDPPNPDLLGQAIWNPSGTPTAIPYTLILQGEAGQCIGFTNTAWVEFVNSRGPETGETVTLCDIESPTISTTADATFDRFYLWQISTDVDATTKTVEDTSLLADFDFTVTAIPDGYEDSDWRVAGAITVANPNSSVLTVDVTDAVDVGGEQTAPSPAARLPRSPRTGHPSSPIPAASRVPRASRGRRRRLSIGPPAPHRRVLLSHFRWPRRMTASWRSSTIKPIPRTPSRSVRPPGTPTDSR